MFVELMHSNGLSGKSERVFFLKKILSYKREANLLVGIVTNEYFRKRMSKKKKVMTPPNAAQTPESMGRYGKKYPVRLAVRSPIATDVANSRKRTMPRYR